MNIKSLLYSFLKLWNDIDSIRRGTVKKRVCRRVTGKATGKAMRKIFK